MWNLCFVLLDESALVFRGKVRKMLFNSSVLEGKFKMYNLISFQDFKFSLPLQTVSTLLSYLCFSHTTHSWNNDDDKDKSRQRAPSHQRKTITGLTEKLHFLFVTGILAVVGSRVASLVVLEFCLRAVSGSVTAGPVRKQLHDKNIPDTHLYQLSCLFHLWLHFAELISCCVIMTQDACYNKQTIICFDSSFSSVHVLLYSPRSPGNFCSNC